MYMVASYHGSLTKKLSEIAIAKVLCLYVSYMMINIITIRILEMNNKATGSNK